MEIDKIKLIKGICGETVANKVIWKCPTCGRRRTRIKHIRRK